VDHGFEFEKAYWGDCCNTFDEEGKHFVYAKLMGIPPTVMGLVSTRKVF
jgi:hypothetical protein